MTNVGTWNSGLAMFYLIVFTFPLWISLLCGAFGALINVNYFEFGDVYITQQKPQKKKKKKRKEISFEEYKQGKKQANQKPIENDVVSALKNMGFKTKESKDMVYLAFVKYPYGDFNTILNECIRKK